jgi:hypothetical protein
MVAKITKQGFTIDGIAGKKTCDWAISSED